MRAALLFRSCVKVKLEVRPVAAGAQAYRDLLTQKAAQFGQDPAQVAGMKQPVLVREISTGDLPDKQQAVTDFNVGGTAALRPAEKAIADSRRVSTDTLDHIAGRLEAHGQDATLSQVLDGRGGADVLQKLISDGVIITDGVVISDGVVITDGVLISDGVIASDGVLISDGVVISDGLVMGSGTNAFDLGVIASDGVVISDGAVISDGVIASDGVLISDGTVASDCYFQAQAAMVDGEPMYDQSIVIDTGIDCLSY